MAKAPVLLSDSRGTCIAVTLTRQRRCHNVTLSQYHCTQAESEPEHDGQMMPDLKGLKQMQKGLQGLLQEVTKDMCLVPLHLASTDATLKVVLASSRIVLQGVNAEIRNARIDRYDRFCLFFLYVHTLTRTICVNSCAICVQSVYQYLVYSQLPIYCIGDLYIA